MLNIGVMREGNDTLWNRASPRRKVVQDFFHQLYHGISQMVCETRAVVAVVATAVALMVIALVTMLLLLLLLLLRA